MGAAVRGAGPESRWSPSRRSLRQTGGASSIRQNLHPARFDHARRPGPPAASRQAPRRPYSRGWVECPHVRPGPPLPDRRACPRRIATPRGGPGCRGPLRPRSSPSGRCAGLSRSDDRSARPAWEMDDRGLSRPIAGPVASGQRHLGTRYCRHSRGATTGGPCPRPRGPRRAAARPTRGERPERGSDAESRDSRDPAGAGAPRRRPSRRTDGDVNGALHVLRESGPASRSDGPCPGNRSCGGYVEVGGKHGTYSGTVTCLRVDGADAWLAGPMTSRPE